MTIPLAFRLLTLVATLAGGLALTQRHLPRSLQALLALSFFFSAVVFATIGGTL